MKPLRTKLYYVIRPSETIMCNLDFNTYVTSNPYILDKFIEQNKVEDFDIYEIEATDILDLNERVNEQYGITIESEQMLDTYCSTNYQLEIVTSQRYYQDADLSHIFDYVENILAAAFYTIKKFLPYIKDEYRNDFENWFKIYTKYVARYVLFMEGDGCIDPKYYDYLEMDKFEVDDVIDEVLVFYMQENGW